MRYSIQRVPRGKARRGLIGQRKTIQVRLKFRGKQVKRK